MPKSQDFDYLRKRAEEFIDKNPALTQKASPEAIHSLIEELYIHQIELEMQNEELRQAQLELQATRDEFSNLYDFAPVGYFTISDKGMVEKANLTGAAMLGIERKLLTGIPFSRLMLQADADIFYLHRKQLLETGSKQTCELRIRKKDQSLFYARLESVRASNEQENAWNMLTAVTDVSETKQAWIMLEEYQKIVESMDELVAVVDREYHFVLVNAAFLQKHGKTRDQVIGRHLAEIMGEETYSHQVKPKIDQAFAGETVEYERSYHFPKLGERHLRACYYPIVSNEKKTIKIAMIIQDITVRKQMDEQLRQAQKMETIGHLAGGIAHDFNNHLQGIMGYADLLCYKLEDQECKNYAEMILRVVQRSADLTGQLLAFARKGKNISVPVDIHKLIFEVISILTQTIDRMIAIKQTLHAHPSVVIGDPSQLENALLNLGINARDAMPQGGELTFATDIITADEEFSQEQACDLSPGRYIRIRVSDSGVGIDEKIQNRIFEPFFTTKEIGKGTGMGLAAVYGIVKNHFGKIKVYSEKGYGAIFTIYLPVIDERLEESVLETADIAKGTACILVVEDEEAVRNTAIKILHNLGYKVAASEDGLEAVEYYREHWQNIDIVILDMVMPRMGGKKAYTAMKKINPDIKVLIATGYGFDGEIQAMVNEGAHGFIQKPFRIRELSNAIRLAMSS